MNNSIINYALYIIVCLYNALDVHHTKLLLECCTAYEANPVLRFFMRHDNDIQAIIIIKCIVLGSVGIILYLYNRQQKNSRRLA